MILLALVLACSTDPPPSPGAAYTRSLSEGDASACEAIPDANLRGECLVFSAADRGEAGDMEGARNLCRALEPGVWQDECWFHLADRIDARDGVAIELCKAAGAFETPCFAHVISRESTEIADQMAVGQEAETLVALRSMATRYVGHRTGRARARHNLRQLLTGRFRGVPFDPAGCGTAPADLCREVYQELINQVVSQRSAPGAPSGQDRLARVCQEGVSLSTVAAEGLPVWAPAGEAMALSAWQELCDRRRLKAPRLKPQAPHRAPATEADTGG